MFKFLRAVGFAAVLFFYTHPVFADNPLVKGVGMADPHIRIFDDKAYLYATMDADPKSKDWVMPEWKVWSSSDMIEWTLEATIKPEDTYIGESKFCWASDAEQRNGRTYFYFSNHNIDTGVLVGETPTGPFKDVLGKPLLPKDLTPFKEYDISILTDDDKNKTPYIGFGHFRDYDDGYRYAVAKLNDDMISLAETPKTININGEFGGNDKPNWHKRNDTYYLSAGAKYAVSKTIYGPYEFVGFSGGDSHPHGLSSQAHGNYFEWRNQWFHVWCEFVWGKEVAKYRESKMTYLHYKDNGEMVDDVAFLDKHYETGVGQYSADWDRIEAEWYMGAWGLEKKENGQGGFELRLSDASGVLFYPNVSQLKKDSTLALRYAANAPSSISVHENSKTGKQLANCQLSKTKAVDDYRVATCQLSNTAGKKDVYLNIKGASVRLDWFAFK